MKEVPLPIPGIQPSFGRAESNERIVHRVAEEDLETTEILVEGGTCQGVPVVQVDSGRYVASGGLEVRGEPIPREAVRDHPVVDT